MPKPLLYIVDDSRTDRLLYDAHLRDDYTISLFSNALSFCDAYKNVQPDIIICDLVMPGMDGWRLVDRIRKVNAKIPVVIATAMDGEEQRFLARRLDCGFWHKTRDYDDLKRELTWHLRLFKPN